MSKIQVMMPLAYKHVSMDMIVSNLLKILNFKFGETVVSPWLLQCTCSNKRYHCDL